MNIKMYTKNLFDKIFKSDDQLQPLKIAIVIFITILIVDYCVTTEFNFVVFFISVMTLLVMYPTCIYNQRLSQEKQIREIQEQKELLQLKESINICMEMNTVILEENSIKSPDTEPDCSTEQANVVKEKKSGQFPAPSARWSTVSRKFEL